MSKRKTKNIVTAIFAIAIFILANVGYIEIVEKNNTLNTTENDVSSYQIYNVPEYSGEVYVAINNNNPNFSIEDMNITEDYYSNLENEKVRNGNGQNLLG